MPRQVYYCQAAFYRQNSAVVIKKIRQKIGKYSFVFASEKEMQNQIADFFLMEGISYVREYPLSPKDRPDFIVRNYRNNKNIAVELKVDGSLQSHLRQLKRYAEYNEIYETLLICIKPQPSAPAQLNNKPLHVIPLWKNIL